MHSSDLSDLSVEPLAIQNLTADEKEQLTDILDGYLVALERGVPPQRKALLAKYPDLAGALGAYLDRLDELHEVAAGFGGASCDE